MRLWSILLILLTAPVTAYSGAWLREKGKGFSSNTVSVTQNYDISESTFLEYGVRDDLTLGAEVSFLASSYGLQSGSATLFLRRPLGRQGRPNVWSAELGIGAAWVGDVVTHHRQFAFVGRVPSRASRQSGQYRRDQPWRKVFRDAANLPRVDLHHHRHLYRALHHCTSDQKPP